MPDFDDWIDAQLRNVPLPPDLLWRLADSGRSCDDAGADARLDAVLANVPVPAHLKPRLRQIAQRRRTPVLWLQLTVAASVFVVLGTAAYLATLGTARTQSKPPVAKAAAKPRPADKSGLATARVGSASAPARKTPAERSTVDEPREAMPGVAAELPFGVEDLVAAGGTVKQAIDKHLRSQGALGAGGAFERLPQLDSFEPPVSRGVLPPRVRGYDLLFQLKQGEHPFASPSAHQALASSRMPFSFRTASYDLAVSGAASGQIPSADEIRVEDFLAAQDYVLPPAPAHGLALHAAASPSPLGEAGLHLLQLAVKTGSKAGKRRQPTRIVAAVELSAKMAGGARWETTLKALAKIADDLKPADRLTLIGFAERPQLLADSATGAELRALLSSGGLPKPSGPADLAAAIRAAIEAVRAGQGGGTQRVVVITAGREDQSKSALERAGDAFAELAAVKVPWQIIRLSPSDASSQLAALAREAQGEVVSAEAASDLHTAVSALVNPEASLIARAAALRLTLNPATVTGYRLLGHASATITGRSADPLEIDLHADQLATAMYELWIKPDGPDPVAVAELTWHDPQSAQPRRRVRAIRRNEIAASFSQAPPWFQQGVIAAKTAEALRGSYYAPSSRPFEQVRELADEVGPPAAERAEFRALLQLLDQARKLR